MVEALFYMHAMRELAVASSAVSSTRAVFQSIHEGFESFETDGDHNSIETTSAVSSTDLEEHLSLNSLRDATLTYDRKELNAFEGGDNRTHGIGRRVKTYQQVDVLKDPVERDREKRHLEQKKKGS